MTNTMKKNSISKLIAICICVGLGIGYGSNIFAIETSNDFEIVPQVSNENTDLVKEAVQDVGSQWWNVREKYNQKAEELDGKVWEQLASGIMTWDTLLDYVVYLVRFLSQIGLVMGWLMIIYAWYLYATTIFWWGDASKWKKAITNAIVGILIIAFSYAIIKLLTNALIS